MERLDTVLVLDFGGQYCHLIGRRIRDLGVYSEIAPPDLSPSELAALGKRLDVRGLVLSGGPSSVHDPASPRCDPAILDSGLPVLGICYGHQLIAQMAGGDVRRGAAKEYGATRATVKRPAGVLSGLERSQKVWMSHADTVFAMPAGWEVLASTAHTPVAAFREPRRGLYGLQWHPEVAHTRNGQRMLSNFVFRVCRARRGWNMGRFIEETVRRTRKEAGGDRCIIGLSGGVDSSTAALLASRAIGRRLVAVYVDHGFMREGESGFIARTFGRFPMELRCVDARERFMGRLRGVSDPERKRRIIGEEFIRVFEEEASRVGARHLIQGTIYPDRIESGFRKHSDKIKSHHNVAGIPADVRFDSIIEPLRDLYKDEVRRVGARLGLPRRLVWRQPFPGPGLSVRVMGELAEEKVEIERRADWIVTSELERARLDRRPWQYFAVLTDTRSVGVKGDSRAYGYVVAVRAVESREAMTASFFKIPYDVLERISTRITNEIPQVNRVVYDITHKPPATIEWE
ncbi:MAG: glutamine-hydrolyzing GMP synthase [Euryarchaeota archaeon]|nr:glutamine-hydrolyzing GMP synthase [Euryarchaeota archaeon]